MKYSLDPMNPHTNYCSMFKNNINKYVRRGDYTLIIWVGLSISRKFLV